LNAANEQKKAQGNSNPNKKKKGKEGEKKSNGSGKEIHGEDWLSFGRSNKETFF